MKIVKTTYANELNKKSERQFSEMILLMEQTQDLITKIEGKAGQPVIAITTKSKNYSLTIKPHA